jgi:L-asparaginase II
LCTREVATIFDRLWIDCIQEEAWIESYNGKQIGIDDENLALAVHARKGRRNSSPRREASLEQRKKKDLSKVKCFACHMLGHYAS